MKEEDKNKEEEEDEEEVEEEDGRETVWREKQGKSGFLCL